MKHRRVRITIALAAAALVALGGTAVALQPPGGRQRAEAKRLEAATVIIEVNGTAGDAGLQFFVDGEPWKSMTVFGPNGRRVVAVHARGRLHDFGLTELFSESNEPPFSELPLRRFLRRFPAGTYTFRGTAIDGQPLAGRARLSHAIPRGPRILAPADGAVTGRRGVVVRWAARPQPPGVHVNGYRLIVTREEPLRILQVELPARVHAIPVPAGFLQRGTEYQVEIQAIEQHGNWTFSESSFTVR